MTTPATDGSLVRRAKEGDEEAFRILFGRHAEVLAARVRRQLSPALLRKISAADVLQDAYMVAVKRMSDFEDRGEGSFGRWLNQIVVYKTRQVVEHFVGTAKRDLRREVTRGKRADTGYVRGPSPSPSEVAIARELEKAAADALRELPEDYREVLRLLQREGVNFEEAAERLGRTLPATRKLYGRALARYAALVARARGSAS